MAGTTHALNAVADGLRLPPEFVPTSRTPLVPLPGREDTSPEIKAIFSDIEAFYAVDPVPADGA